MNDHTTHRKTTPALNNLGLIPQIFNLYFAGKCKLTMDEKIGVILRLFDPVALEGSKPIDRSLISRLFCELETSPKQVKNYLVSVRGYMLIYRSFKETVERSATNIAGYYSAS